MSLSVLTAVNRSPSRDGPEPDDHLPDPAAIRECSSQKVLLHPQYFAFMKLEETPPTSVVTTGKELEGKLADSHKQQKERNGCSWFGSRFLLMMGVLFCCGAGFFIRRRLHPPRLTDDPPFTVGFTRQPVNTTTGTNQTGMQYYTEPGAPVVNPIASTFHIQPNFPLLNPAYPPPPAYCNQPPPPYEQVVKTSNKEGER